MRSFSKTKLMIGCMVLLTATAFSGEMADTLKTPAPDDLFVVETRHRLFPEFRQVDTVTIGQVFLIGEEELKAEVVKFNPDFAVTDSGQYLQVTDTLYNPAVYMRVTLADGKVQESWGFYFMDAPHYRRDNLLGFKLVDFKVSDKYVMPPLKK